VKGFRLKNERLGFQTANAGFNIPERICFRAYFTPGKIRKIEIMQENNEVNGVYPWNYPSENPIPLR